MWRGERDKAFIWEACAEALIEIELRFMWSEEHSQHRKMYNADMAERGIQPYALTCGAQWKHVVWLLVTSVDVGICSLWWRARRSPFLLLFSVSLYTPT